MLCINFDKRNKFWKKDPVENLRFLKRMEEECNNILYKKGYLFLTDALTMMGIKDPWIEDSYGWWLDYDDLPWNVENYISFGIYDSHVLQNRRFINCLSPNALLKFNVSGNVAHYLLDRAMTIGGLETAQDFFDYPWLHYKEIEWSDYIWEK